MVKMSLGRLVIWFLIAGTAAGDQHIAEDWRESTSCEDGKDEFAFLQVNRVVVDSQTGRYDKGGDDQEAEAVNPDASLIQAKDGKGDHSQNKHQRPSSIYRCCDHHR